MDGPPKLLVGQGYEPSRIPDAKALIGRLHAELSSQSRWSEQVVLSSVMAMLIDLEMLLPTAHYFSTHCLHDHHDQCKVTCKHCTERCKCDCHGGL